MINRDKQANLSIPTENKLTSVIMVHRSNLIVKDSFTNYSTGTEIEHLK